MKFDDIKIISEPLALATPGEVAEMESVLQTKFSSEYLVFITKYGEGILGGTYIRIYPPWQIMAGDNSYKEWRKRIDVYWFWDDGREILSKNKALECIIIGDTYDGDEIIFHPSEPEVFYVLPRYEENIYRVGPGLLGAMEWLCTAGKLTEPFEERNFEPFDSRKQA